MSVTQAKNFRRFKRLLMELHSYGLNPYDWRVERSASSGESLVYLQHRTDRDFRLYGTITQTVLGETHLESLALASL